MHDGLVHHSSIAEVDPELRRDVVPSPAGQRLVKLDFDFIRDAPSLAFNELMASKIAATDASAYGLRRLYY